MGNSNNSKLKKPKPHRRNASLSTSRTATPRYQPASPSVRKIANNIANSNNYDELFITYSIFQQNVRELDLVFFRSSDIISNAIAIGQEVFFGVGQWSHVGMVISKQLIPSGYYKYVKDDPPDTYYLWESTFSSNYRLLSPDMVVDAITKKPAFGVQIRRLFELVDKSIRSGKVSVGWSQLKNNPLFQVQTTNNNNINNNNPNTFSFTKEIQKQQPNANRVVKQIKKLFADYRLRPYARNCCRLCSPAMPKLKWICGCVCCKHCCSDHSQGVFCSEFVTSIYQKIGIVSPVVKPELISPEELAHGNERKKSLKPLVVAPRCIVLDEDQQQHRDNFRFTFDIIHDNSVKECLNEIPCIDEDIEHDMIQLEIPAHIKIAQLAAKTITTNIKS